MRKFVYVSGVLFFMLQMLGVIFKILHWPGANILMMAGGLLFLIFVPAAAWYSYHKFR